MADNFPVATLAEAREHLRRPFAPTEIKWKCEATWPKDGAKKGGIVVPFIDARLVIDRLDTVVGPLWSDEYELVPGTKAMLCRLSIDGSVRSDVGESAHSTKATVSDSLKRAAVHYGIGLSIYAMNPVRLNCTESGFDGEDNPVLKQTKRGQKHSAEITDELLARLRKSYSKWIEQNTDRFGTAIEHGGDEHAIGLDPETNGSEPAEQPSLETAAKVTELEQLYEQLPNKRGWGQAKWSQMLKAAAAQGMDGLTELEKQLREKAGTAK